MVVCARGFGMCGKEIFSYKNMCSKHLNFFESFATCMHNHKPVLLDLWGYWLTAHSFSIGKYVLCVMRSHFYPHLGGELTYKVSNTHEQYIHDAQYKHKTRCFTLIKRLHHCSFCEYFLHHKKNKQTKKRSFPQFWSQGKYSQGCLMIWSAWNILMPSSFSLLRCCSIVLWYKFCMSVYKELR